MKKIIFILKKLVRKFKNYHPSKWESLCFLIIPLLIGLLCSANLDNDVWFILNYGRYITTNGFPVVDSFTIHEGLELVIQQWAVDVIFYKCYELFSVLGLYVTVNLINIYIIFITYKLLMLVTDKKRNLSVLFTIIIVTLFDFNFLTSRPQIFSSSILLTELYVLEKYIKTKNNRILWLLPILSFLMINFHASMWLLLFCLLIPFFINTFKFKIGRLTSDGGDKKDFFIFSILMIIVGFLNPYGIKAMTYLFTSYNVPYIYNFVGEMKIIDAHTLFGIYVYLCIFIVYICYILIIKKEIKIYHFLLMLGTTYLAISSNRGIAYFLIAAIYPIAIYLKDNFYYIKEPNNNNKMKLLFVVSIIFLVIIPFCFLLLSNRVEIITSAKDSVDYLIKNDDIKNIKLYCGYDQCNYAQYLGIKTYTDSRAEIFLKDNNHKEDILKELYNLLAGNVDIDKFLEKYNFTHLLVNRGDALYDYLIDNDNYIIIYENDFEDKNLENNVYKVMDYHNVIFKKINN